jgi:hypothetical protein
VKKYRRLIEIQHFLSRVNGFWRAVREVMEDHPKHLVVYYHSKGYKTKIIYGKLQKCLGPDAPPYSTVRYWIRMLKVGKDIFEIDRRPGRPPDAGLDEKILGALSDFPFHTTRSLARELKIPRSTIHMHLLNAGFVLKHLKWVPHSLSEARKKSRVEICQQLLDIYRKAKHDG